MKKAIWLVLVLLSICLPGRGQNTDNNGDDTYYPQPSDNYDDTYNDNQNADNGDNGDNSGVTYQTFYDQLSPYGSWVNYPGQGYVWVPNQDADFSPYVSNGHWVYSDMGWTWVSDFPWGWAPFHYGRWFLDDSYGWMWLPGYQWAPAWVVWGDYDGYYCWAPIGWGGYIGAGYRPDARYWNFVRHDHITDINIRDRAYENRGMVHNVPDINKHINVYNHANTYHQAVYFSGPRAQEVEKATGQKITPMHIAPTTQAGATHVAGNQINIYRPAIRNTPNQPAPPKVSRTEDLRQGNRPAVPAQQPVQHNAPAQQQAVQHNAPAPEQQRPQPTTPPRQSTPLPQRAPTEAPAEKPHGRYFEPNPAPQQQSRPVQSAPSRSFSAPAPSRSFSAPAPAGGGGGNRGGGGGGRR